VPVGCASGLCQWPVPGACARGLCQRPVPGACASGLCQWPVPVACASGLFQWPVPVACSSGLCQWPVPLACASGLCQWPVPGACARGLCQGPVPGACASGLHYKRIMTIVKWGLYCTSGIALALAIARVANYTLRVMLQTVSSLTDDSRGVIICCSTSHRRTHLLPRSLDHLEAWLPSDKLALDLYSLSALHAETNISAKPVVYHEA
jgi:hypothetical protein